MTSLQDAVQAVQPGDAGLIGYPLSHSLSPALQNAAFRWLWRARRDSSPVPEYRLFPVQVSELPRLLAVLHTRGVRGLNVTVPYKEIVASACTDLSDFARSVGAVNTLTPLGTGGYRADNTDGEGFLRSIWEDLKLEGMGLRAVVLGAGGTGRVLVQSLLGAGAASVGWWNRSPEKAAGLAGKMEKGHNVALLATDAALAAAVPSADLVVNATSVGLKEGDGLPAPGLAFRRGQRVFDVVYHRRTAFLTEAERAGAIACGGLGMLLHQAAKAFEIWTGSQAPIDVMRAALIAAAREKGLKPIWPSAI